MQLLKYHKYTTKKIIMFFLASFLLIFNTYSQKYTVVLDAGHGGKDPGASKYGRIEKKIALNVVLKAGKILEKNSKINVVYTRKSDVFVELHKRATIANKKNADLFVSVHCNANNRSVPHGAETYVLGLKGNAKNMAIAKKENAVILLEDNYKNNYDYDPNSPESVIGLSVLQEENLDASVAFASLTQQNFTKVKRKDRSVQQANFLVLRETVMPSVLIELGFITNKEEGRFLNSKLGQTKMAKAIANAIITYVNQLQKNTVIPTEKEPKSDIVYCVQIAASKKYKPSDKRRYKGLKNIEIKKVGKYYCYFYGNTSEYKQATQYLKKVKQNGVKGAFIVAFEKGKRISVKSARNKQKK
ncbi:MAG: N-acetylmuramoyl-L-alanine amidase [Polaribacter sp.]|nr:MAG: N-acetylmuramoyl-L-alanine amidase [Polaribacter sp.]